MDEQAMARLVDIARRADPGYLIDALGTELDAGQDVSPAELAQVLGNYNEACEG